MKSEFCNKQDMWGTKWLTNAKHVVFKSEDGWEIHESPLEMNPQDPLGLCMLRRYVITDEEKYRIGEINNAGTLSYSIYGCMKAIPRHIMEKIQQIQQMMLIEEM